MTGGPRQHSLGTPTVDRLPRHAVGAADARAAADRAAAAQTGQTGRPGRSRVPTWAMVLGAAAVYTAIAVFAYHSLLFAPTASMPGCVCGDQAQEVWLLHWPLYALLHGHNPFYSNWMDYPQGINLTIDTSATLLGILSAPMQLTIGAVGSYDVLLMASMAGSALSMCLVLRRWVRSWIPAFAGGLLYGYSSFMAGQGAGHVFLVAAFIPPIVLLVLHDLVVVQRHPAWRDGLLLGLLLAAQYYISPEVLAMTVVIGVCGVALLALARPREVPARIRHVLTGAAWGAVLLIAAIAYPVWMSVAGPQHVVGAPHPLAGLALYPGDLLGPVLPTAHTLLGPAAVKARGDALTGTNASENGMYLGLPLIAVLAALGWWFRRSRALLFFLAMTVVATVLALGSHLTVDTHVTAIPLPFIVLEHLPFLRDILAVRFSLFMQLFGAASLAVGLDLLVARLRRSRAASATRALVPAAVAAFALVPLIPAIPYQAVSAAPPPFFTSAAVHRIPAGSAVLAYPYPLAPDASWNLVYQAEAGFRFKLIGGNAPVPGPGGKSVSTPTVLHPQVVERIFADAYTPGFAQSMLGPPPNGTPRVDARTVSALRTLLGRYHVRAVVIVDGYGVASPTIVSYVTDALGPPTRVGGVSAWFDVPRLLRAPARSTAAATAPAATGTGTSAGTGGG